MLETVSGLIANEHVVGYLAGRMEFGPRALGNRSIIGDASGEALQGVLNLKIKFRESFRAVRLAVLREDVSEYFDMKTERDSLYMLVVANVPASKYRDLNGNHANGLDRLGQVRSMVPAITHVDYSRGCRRLTKNGTAVSTTC